MSSNSLSPTSTEMQAVIRQRRESDVSDDVNVQMTNDDASESKYSAINLGYWQDPHVKYFVRHSDRKSPEIHRGYYARVKSIRMIVDKFLAQFDDKSTQIINLGCGFDTLFWQLHDAKGRMPKNFVDVDFSTITAKKIHHIMKPSSALRKGVDDESSSLKEIGHKNLYGPIYRLIGADIRDVNELDGQFVAAGVDFNQPTLFIAECVLIYMTVEQGDAVLKYLSHRFPRAYFLHYDPVNMKDKFGNIFQENMYNRGLLLAGVDACESLATTESRFRSNGWKDVKVWTLRAVYSSFLPKQEIARIESIEPLDEKELLDQLLDHYCIVVARMDETLPSLHVL